MLEMKRLQIHQAPAPVQAQAQMDAQAGMVWLKELELKAESSDRSKFRCLCLPQRPPRWMSQALRINLRDPLPQKMCHLQSGCAYRLNRPGGSGGLPSGLFPPGFAGVRQVHGDVPLSEFSSCDEWLDEVGEVLDKDLYESDLINWDAEGESPPVLEPSKLAQVDLESDRHELTRLLEMGVVRPPREHEDVSPYGFLTTKIVRDWRKRPGWTRRSRLVAREFRSWTPWTQDLFAPASSLAVVHSLMAAALSKNLELATIDIKDAYLNVSHKAQR